MELVEGTSLITGPNILTYKADITVHVTKQNQKKKGTRKNTIESSNGSQLKFWQIFAMKRALKKIIAPEQMDMYSRSLT